MSEVGTVECKNKVDVATQALGAYCEEPGTSGYNLDEALDTLVTLTKREQGAVYSEQQGCYSEVIKKP